VELCEQIFLRRGYKTRTFCTIIKTALAFVGKMSVEDAVIAAISSPFWMNLSGMQWVLFSTF
jgi:hypothetical protein